MLELGRATFGSTSTGPLGLVPCGATRAWRQAGAPSWVQKLGIATPLSIELIAPAQKRCKRPKYVGRTVPDVTKIKTLKLHRFCWDDLTLVPNKKVLLCKQPFHSSNSCTGYPQHFGNLDVAKVFTIAVGKQQNASTVDLSNADTAFARQRLKLFSFFCAQADLSSSHNLDYFAYLC